MENKQEILRVVDLEKKFHKLEVLKGINVSFHENEVVSIIGPSGGGKSTFLRCLNLLEQPTSGQIYLMVRTSAPSRARPSTSAASGWVWYSSSSTCSTTWTLCTT